MTTGIPTNSDAANAALFPENLPDEATLARLANTFFQMLPESGARAIPGVIESGTGGLPQPARPFSDSAPAYSPDLGAIDGGNLLPENAPLREDNVQQLIPAVPSTYAAALPMIDPPMLPVSVPTSPYYFIGESSAYPSQAKSVIGEDRITAQTFALPGTGQLHGILAGITVGRFTETPAKPDPRRQFYFVDSGSAEGAVPALPGGAHPPFDVHAVRRDFPILSERVHGRPLVWFDNAATTQKPQAVIDRLAWFYAHENSNIHRAAHDLAARATDAYEGARSKVARFLGASSAEEIIFVRGATEGVNLVAQTFGKQFIGAGDEIVISHLEHHANIVPWQQIAAEKGAKIRVIPVDDSGQILLDEYRELLNSRTKLVAITQVSNALGTVTPVHEVVALAHSVGARALVDGAQAVSHMRVNMQALDADFFVFSGHKIFAPTGIGVVYGKKALLDSLPPWQGGGNMITDVTFERTVYQKAPARFEAGTGNIADAVGLGAALDYLEHLGLENVARYEHDLLAYATQAMLTVPGLRLIGTAKEKTSVLSFVLANYRTEEVGKALSEEGIAVRAGHHCAQPILRRFGLETTVRPSIAFYNTCDEVDHMVRVLHRLARRT